MWKELTKLFEKISDHRKLALKDKLQKIKMEKNDIIMENLPKWERLWPNLVQEEFRRNNRDGTSSKVKDEENFALVGKRKKVKGKKSQAKPESSQRGKKKDFSKTKRFNCDEFDHYATKHQHKKSSKKKLERVAGEALASQFELDFTLIACMASIVMDSVWYLDSSASFHMTGCRDIFNDLEEKDLKLHIGLGDERRYCATGIGIVTFQRESRPPLHLKDVMFVPSLKKNIVFVLSFGRMWL
eukprot:PITA_25710